MNNQCLCAPLREMERGLGGVCFPCSFSLPLPSSASFERPPLSPRITLLSPDYTLCSLTAPFDSLLNAAP